MALDSVKIKFEVDANGLKTATEGIRLMTEADANYAKQSANFFESYKQQQLQKKKLATEEIATISTLKEAVKALKIERDKANSITAIAAFNQKIHEQELAIKQLSNVAVTEFAKIQPALRGAKIQGDLGGLRNSINQLTRELPAFTFSAQTGFMAISNNIPILIDEIGRLKKANLDLAKAGEPTQSVFKALASSFFSLGTLMSVGITLLTVYGKEIGNFVSGLFSAEKQTEAMKIETEKYNKVLQESIDLEIELIKARGGNAYAQEQLRLVQKLTSAKIDVADIEEKIGILQAKNAIQQANVNSAITEKFRTESQKKIDITNKEIATLETQLQTKVQAEENAQTKISIFEAKISKDRIDKNKKDNDDAIKEAERLRKAKEAEEKMFSDFLADVEESNAEARRNRAIQDIANEKTNTKRQIETLDDGLQKELELFEFNAMQEVQIATTKGEDLAILEELQAKQRQDIKEKYAQKERDLYEKTLRAESDAREKATDEEMKNLEDAENQKAQLRQQALQQTQASLEGLFNYAAQLNKQEIDNEADAQTTALENEKNKKLSNKRLTDKQRIAIEKEYADKILAIQKKAFEQKKKEDIANVVINTAVGIIKTFATLGYPIGIAPAAALAITGAAQVALIEKQKFEKGGVVKGKRHSQGGVDINAEVDEFITNRNDSIKNRPLLEAVNKGKGHDYIMKHFVMPALINSKMAEKKEAQGFGNLAQIMSLNGMGEYNDKRLRDTVIQSAKANAKYLAKELKSTPTTNSRYF